MLRQSLVVVYVFMSFTLCGQDSLMYNIQQIAKEPALVDSLKHNFDSVRVKVTEKLENVESVRSSIADKSQKAVDFISDPIPNDVFRSLDSVNSLGLEFQQKFQDKLDSLNSIGVPAVKYQSQLDTIVSKTPVNEIHKVEAKISEANTKIDQKINSSLGKVNNRLEVLRKESEGGTVLPPPLKEVDVPGMQLPKTPDVQIKSDAALTTPTSNIPVGDLRSSNIKIGTDIREISEGTQVVTEASSTVSGYVNEVRKAEVGNFGDIQKGDNDLVSEVMSDEVKSVQDELSNADSQLKSLESFRNQEAFKKRAIEKGRALVLKQMVEHESRIVAVVNKISTYQKRQGTIFNRIKGLPKRSQTEKKPSFTERIIPSLTLQVQRPEHWWLDINPAVHYRIRSMFSAGVGWNERIIFDNHLDFYRPFRIRGARTFCEFSVFKGIWVRGDAESMYASIPSDQQKEDKINSEWYWNYLLGVKKEFSFSVGVISNVQFMYGLNNVKATGLYQSRFNVRFGFQFPIKKNK